MTNSHDVTWMEKLFRQYREDQRKYLDEKFDDIGKKLDNRIKDCKDCRACIDSNILALNEEIKKNNKDTTRKVLVGGAVAVAISITLWSLFGTDAISIVLSYLGKLSGLGM